MAILKKIPGKHIKHSPNVIPVLMVEQDSRFLVKSSTPYVSILKQVTKMLNKFQKLTKTNRKFKSGEYRKVKYITMKGMGKCIEKTLSAALVFQEQNYKVDISTGSVEVVDEFVSKGSGNESEGVQEKQGEEEEEEEVVFQKRAVSTIEVKIWIKRDV